MNHNRVIYNEMISGENVKIYEEELIDNLRDKTYCTIPLNILVLSRFLCIHQCHFASILLSKGMDHFSIKRGNVNIYPLVDGEPNHSWVEKDGWVYDTTFGFKIKKDLYYYLYEPFVMEEYDEETIKEDDVYINLMYKDMNDEFDLKSLKMILDALKYFETKRPTFNGKRMLKEIEEYEKNNLKDIIISKKKMLLYINMIKKDYLTKQN